MGSHVGLMFPSLSCAEPSADLECPGVTDRQLGGASTIRLRLPRPRRDVIRPPDRFLRHASTFRSAISDTVEPFYARATILGRFSEGDLNFF